MPEIRAVNDFVIKFGNVNGTGSASANNLFAKAVFRMGVPVSPRNIFPSNIQGLPTWFEVRVSEAGHLGRRGGVDIMVAMNPASLREDVDSLLPGGYLLFDSSKPLDRRRFRTDINWLGVPLTEICLGQYRDARQRQLFKNIVYVGALSALLDMEFETVTGLVADQFRGKDRLIAPNVKALELGSTWGPREPRLPHRHPGAPERSGRRTDPRQRQFRRRSRLRLCGGDGRGLVSHHPFDLARGRLLEPLRTAPRGPGDRGEELRGRPGGGRARGDRDGDRRLLERGRGASPRRAGPGSRS